MTPLSFMQRVYLQQPNSSVFFLTDRSQTLSASKSMHCSYVSSPVICLLCHSFMCLTSGCLYTEDLDNLKKEHQDM